MSSSHATIAHIMPWSSIGGTEHATLRIIQSVARDFNNIVFCPEGENAVSEMFRAAGVDTVGYEIVEPSLRRPGGYLRASSRLAKELKRRKVDLVHCSDFLACCYSAVAGRMARLPVLCHVRNRFAEIPLRDRLVLSAVDKFVFVSQDTWRHFGYQVSANRGLVLYDGIDVRGEASSAEVRQEFGIPTATKIIGMVARVAPQKDYATLIKAAKLIVKEYPDVCFLIVGDYSKGENHKVHYAEVKRELDAFGMTPYFIFTDFREDVPRMIGAMDIFVLSTHLEGLPLVILEAMAQGKAVVATAVDGIPEVVVGGRTGLLYEHEDETQLARHLLSLLQNPERACAMGEAGRRHVNANFTREQFASNLNNLYANTLGRTKPVEALNS